MAEALEDKDLEPMEPLPVGELDTPAVVVDLDVVEKNLHLGADYAARAGAALRPHCKTHKSPYFARRQLTLGATGICVAKVGEAETFAGAGFMDIFIPNTIVGAGKARRLRALVERGVRLAVGVDHIEQARGLSAAMSEIEIMIEVDTGSHRGGVPVATAVGLAKEASAFPGLRVRGVYAYEGYQYSATDRDALAIRTWEGERALVEVGKAVGAALGIDPVISAGSTPALAAGVPCYPGVTELRPGTYIFFDAAQAHAAETLEHCAAHVLATVVSRPAPDRAILDSGSKTLTADVRGTGVCATEGHGLVCDLGGRPYPGLVVTHLSEEHGIVEGPTVDQLQVGQKVFVLPNHICPVVNLFDEVFCARNGQVERVLPVAARGRPQ